MSRAEEARAYRARNAEAIRARDRARYAADPEKRLAHVRRWREQNRPRLLALLSRYGQEHRDEINERLRKWRSETGFSRTEYHRKRRAAKRATVVSLTPEGWAQILEEFGNRCAYCMCVMVTPTQDHIVPLSKGGDHSPGNVVPACLSCNSRKCDRSLLQFVARFG